MSTFLKHSSPSNALNFQFELVGICLVTIPWNGTTVDRSFCSQVTKKTCYRLLSIQLFAAVAFLGQRLISNIQILMARAYDRFLSKFCK